MATNIMNFAFGRAIRFFRRRSTFWRFSNYLCVIDRLSSYRFSVCTLRYAELNFLVRCVLTLELRARNTLFSIHK